MAYKTYFFRGPTKKELLSDLQSVLPDDTPYLFTDENGELQIRSSVAIVLEEGEWWIEKPTFDSEIPANKTSAGTRADYAILNVRTDDSALQSLIESFNPSDPSKEPSEVPSSEKIGNGTHRITQPNSPARTFQ